MRREIKDPHQPGWKEMDKIMFDLSKKSPEYCDEETIRQEKVDALIKEALIQESSFDYKQAMKMDFFKALQKAGGEILAVGGAVRDEYLGKQSKDVDLLVRNLSLDKIEQILSKYGKYDSVGKSFGVIKFMPKGIELDEPIDIAIPRKERKMTDQEKDAIEKETGKRPKGYQAFTSTSDPNLPLKADLVRRDFTINAIGKGADGKTYDPFNGESDLKKKIIRMVDKKAFSDDPLRMLRAVQFAARFGFTIEPNTWNEIKKNAGTIKSITGERILIELNKIIDKGSPKIGIDLLVSSGLYTQIFGFKFQGDTNLISKAKTRGEFIWSILQGSQNPDYIFTDKLKGDLPTAKEIKALDYCWDTQNFHTPRLVISTAYRTSPAVIKSNLLPNKLVKAANELSSGKYPLGLSQLQINGEDLMKLGFKGKEIGEKLSQGLIGVYQDKVKNKKEDLINFIVR